MGVSPNDPAIRADRDANQLGISGRRSRSDWTRPVTAVTWHGLRRAAVLLVISYLALTAVWTGLGLFVTGPLANSLLSLTDRDVATWLVERRTPSLDAWSRVGTMPADTAVKVVATAIIAVVMAVAWRPVGVRRGIHTLTFDL